MIERARRARPETLQPLGGVARLGCLQRRRVFSRGIGPELQEHALELVRQSAHGGRIDQRGQRRQFFQAKPNVLNAIPEQENESLGADRAARQFLL